MFFSLNENLFFCLLVRPWGLTALCLACFYRHLPIIEYLLENNFDANQTDKCDATDRYFSCLSNDNEHKMKFTEMKRRVAQDMGMFFYPIHLLVKQNDVQAVRLVLNYKEKINVEVKELITDKRSLHFAAEKSFTEVSSSYTAKTLFRNFCSDHRSST